MDLESVDPRYPSPVGTLDLVGWRAQRAEATLAEALAELEYVIEELASPQWDPDTGEVRDDELSTLAPRDGGWSVLMFPPGSVLSSAVSHQLSRKTDAPVAWFQSVDQTAWGFGVRKSGEQVAEFWNNPDFIRVDPANASADPEHVAGLFRVEAATLAPYLRHVAFGDEVDKAFDDDEHTLDDHWVFCDFMRRLGMAYPEHDDPNTRRVRLVQR